MLKINFLVNFFGQKFVLCKILHLTLRCKIKKQSNNNQKQRKMKTTVKQQDIQEMIKNFNLDDNEANALTCIAKVINGEATNDDHQWTDPWKDDQYWDDNRKAAKYALMMYLGKKYQQESGYVSVADTCFGVARMLEIDPIIVYHTYHHICLSGPRFNRFKFKENNYQYMEINF